MSDRALIFDCDGVLADTESEAHLPAFNEAFRELQLPVEWSLDEYAVLVRIGGGKERLKTLFEGPLHGSQWDTDDTARDELIRSIHRIKTERYIQIIQSGRITPRPGVRRLAEEAAAAGWLLAVASTSAEESVRAVLHWAVGEELAARFSIFAGDVVVHKKPAPDIYLLAIASLGVDAGSAVVIEDSEIGCLAATTAEIATVVTTSTFTQEEHFPGAALVLASLDGGPGRATGPVTLETLEGLVASEPRN